MNEDKIKLIIALIFGVIATICLILAFVSELYFDGFGSIFLIGACIGFMIVGCLIAPSVIIPKKE